MAAHAVTGLTETLERANGTSQSMFYHLRIALELDSWTSDLSVDGFMRLVEGVERRDRKAIREVAEDLLVDVSREWVELGKPSCREEWHKAKFGKGA
jgi:hypothetical protein